MSNIVAVLLYAALTSGSTGAGLGTPWFQDHIPGCKKVTEQAQKMQSEGRRIPRCKKAYPG